jgi:hypothetical protein
MKRNDQPNAKAIWIRMQALHFLVERMRAALEMAAGRSYGKDGPNVVNDVHHTYCDIMSDDSLTSKNKAIEALQFDGIIDYAALKLRTQP